jgi:HK97 family phage major capsid protein
MPYDSLTNRTDTGSLMPEEFSREIIQTVPERSAVLQMARRLPNMTRAQSRIPVLSVLPTAYFVQGDTGLKQTTETAWRNVYINAEELAVIVPIPENVIADVDYDIWGEIRPLIVEALGGAIDAAMLYGTNKPASWPDGITVGANAAGNEVVLGAGGGDLFDDIMGEGGVLGLVEADGYEVTGHIAAMSMKARLRGLRDTDGQPIFLRSMQDTTRYELDGNPLMFPRNGSVNPAASLLVSGDWEQMVYSVRQDITWKVLDQAVIQDNNGVIIYNLPQQDMIALRCTMRLGWALPNPINRIQTVDANRYPFAVLKP